VERVRRTLLLLWLAAAAPGAAAAGEPLDLNRATREELAGLPVPPDVAQGIWEYREFVDWFTAAEDLLRVSGMTPEMLARLRPLVSIVPVPPSPEMQRKEDLFYRFEWWEGSEGADESLVELYKDLALRPVDVNEATLLDLQNLQSMSPIGAVAIAKYRDRVGRIGNQAELRRAPGLSGWNYSNARNFLTYGDRPDDEPRRLHGAYSLRVETTTWFDEVEDMLREDRDPAVGTNDNWWDRLDLDSPAPAISQKLLLRWGRRLSGGFSTVRRLGEQELAGTRKAFLGVEDAAAGPVKLDKLLVGHYSLSWGQGVIMDNSDFRSARQSGYGFGKRYDGILGDVSRGDEFALRGAAAEARWGSLRALGFFSDEDRDAILNDDGSVNLLVRMTPRIEDEDLVAAGLSPIRDQLHEKTWGGNLRWDFGYGRHVGVGGYESRYDRFFDPKWDPSDPTDKHPLVADDDEDTFVAQDSELFASYRSPGKYRRVHGADFQWVEGNLALQGEYGELETDGELLRIGDDPSALVLNSYLQYENLDFLALYRDYDVGFDNPYQRSFSNYERFKGTIVEDYFRLEDPVYGFLFQNAFQPQAERGFYFNTRFRFFDPLIFVLEHDNWRRQGDMSRYSRFVGRVEYRLLFPLRLKLRHKWQNRELDNLRDPSIFNNVETRIELEYRLSRFDQLEFLYATSYTKWPPRGRLQGTPDATGESPISGSNAEPGWAFGGWWTHHFANERAQLDGAMFVYDGFLWFFEKNTFRVADGEAFRSFVEIADRVSDGLTLRARWVRENRLRNTAVDIRQFNEEVGGTVDAADVKRVTSYFRVQADWTF
jgi:DNA uptake protein ComE-like DNA-binding protein